MYTPPNEIRRNDGALILVDAEDLEWLGRYPWCAGGCNGAYAATRVCGRLLLMHRVILNCEDDLRLDHANGNGLDNRKCNLRPATALQNSQNVRPREGRYKGAVLDPRDGKWHAQICIDGKMHAFAYGMTEEECARSYDQAAKYHFGAFARLNFGDADPKPYWEIGIRGRNKPGRTSSFRGVRATGKKGRFQALLLKKHIGCYDTQEEAARAYDAAAKAALGDKAILNFPQDHSSS